MKIGDNAQIISLNVNGIIESFDESSGKIVLKCGSVRVKALKNDVKILLQEKYKKKITCKSRRNFDDEIFRQNSQDYLDLHGKTVQEAIFELEQFINEAIFCNLREIKIIHGKGTGVLRREIGNFLKINKKIKSFRTGFLHEGGIGVTIILL